MEKILEETLKKQREGSWMEMGRTLQGWEGTGM